MIKPLNSNVLVLIEKKSDKTKSGIFIATEEDPRMESAKVLDVAKEVEMVKKGDLIYFKSYALSEIEVDSKLYGFLKEEEILAKK